MSTGVSIAARSTGMNPSNQTSKSILPGLEHYRSKEAQDLHSTIIGYITGTLNQNTLIQTINHIALEPLLATSINGCTHLFDAVHLPFKMTKDTSAEKCTTLIKHLCS